MRIIVNVIILDQCSVSSSLANFMGLCIPSNFSYELPCPLNYTTYCMYVLVYDTVCVVLQEAIILSTIVAEKMIAIFAVPQLFMMSV